MPIRIFFLADNSTGLFEKRAIKDRREKEKERHKEVASQKTSLLSRELTLSDKREKYSWLYISERYRKAEYIWRIKLPRWSLL